MYEDFEDYEEIDVKAPKINYKYLVMIILILLLMYLVYTIAFAPKSYHDYEKALVSSAKVYVKENGIQTSKEIYLDANKLQTELPDNCALTSGVFYDGSSYLAYLMCSDYQSEILDKQIGDISLMGESVEILLSGEEYIEYGCLGFDNIEISGKVGSAEGVYQRYYFSGGDYLTRKVVVINSNLSGLKPNIELIGEAVDYLLIDSEYVDLGIRAYDSIDGDITSNVKIVDNINPYQKGEYQVLYTVRNSRGYESKITRKVIVIYNRSNIEFYASLNNKALTNEKVIINVNITGSDYQYSILPDGKKINQYNYLYEVDKNGKYTFQIYDKNNVLMKREVVVDNIIQNTLEGSCSAVVYNDYVDVSVSMESDIEMMGYNYIINNESSGYKIINEYRKYISDVNSVDVLAQDMAGNEKKLSCSIKINDPTVGNPNIQYYQYNNTEYVIANTQNNLDTFLNHTCHKIAQEADKINCGDACLSFALYYAAYLQKGSLQAMNQYNACNYNYGDVAKFKSMSNATKEDALDLVYQEILSGRVSVLQVTGTPERNSRHFITVVGYQRNKYSSSDLTEEDLLGIDSWTGCLTTISYYDTKKRTMYNNKDGMGYRVDVFR